MERRNFNAEDQANRLWYQAEVKQTVKVWTSKFLWGLLRVLIGDAWVLYSEAGSIMKYADFRRICAEYILKH